ncbi:hypothetical protein [Clostridium tyrobutyricum]|uniref:hypothetical protein n=1 Tax=Clostridium tyrobutyricum TaxID=1519 RepID=UPI00073D28EB|nr:hypothetical protein [Clostridium tyrobutyricum]
MDIKQLIKVLTELRSESLKLGNTPSESEIKSLMHKYDMLFLGKNFNYIYSSELCYALKNYFHLEINNDKLNSLLPHACKCLNMKYEPLIKASKLGQSSEPDFYQIILWQ